MRESSGPSGQGGFSLLELIVALAVTLVVTGAVYGLMAGGNNAFRREPELTERQQNARVAMDMIQRDIANAGTNLGPLFQSFTQNLNAKGRVTGPTGQVADHLEVFGNDGTCPDAPTRIGDPTNGANVIASGPIPACYSEDALVVVIYNNGGAKWGVGHEIHAQNKMINFPGGLNGPGTGSQIVGPAELAEWVPGDGSAPVALSPLNLVRYEIGFDPPAAAWSVNAVPGLYRSPTGGRDPSNNATYLPPDSAANVTAGRWQLLARGVEDLQVQYRNGTGAWSDDPGAVTCAGDCKTPTTAEYNKGVREVRVTMSVRAEGYNLAGQTAGNAATTGRPNAVRGNVTTVTTVKALQNYLSAVQKTAACPECPVWR